MEDTALIPAEQRLVQAAVAISHDERWAHVAMLPTHVMVTVPIPQFRVRDVLALEPGSIVTSAWRGGKDVPVLAGEVQFAWAEFEVFDEELGARITRVL